MHDRNAQQHITLQDFSSLEPRVTITVLLLLVKDLEETNFKKPELKENPEICFQLFSDLFKKLLMLQ